ncbi:MAG TPA: CoA transferase, partial [Stellaceae bacterium]|nr:CoA transferase [Stellaceae bacterium]
MIDAAVARLSQSIAHWSAAIGRRVAIDADILDSRARLQGFAPQGQVSANSSCRLLVARDGWVALNLPRAEDWELMSAWLRCDLPRPGWDDIAAVIADQPAGELVSRAALLGLAAALPGEAGAGALAPKGDVEIGRARCSTPVVLDLSALWAGPLAASIFAQAGAEVVKVESAQRPDPTARRSADFDALLNGMKRRVTLDFGDPAQRARLHKLLDEADIVITSARPRGLASIGLLPALRQSRACGRLWIAITAHGMGRGAGRIGFGDDCA